MNEFMPRDFKPGDKVWFMNHFKAVVADDEPFGVRETFPYWAVPISIKGEVVVTVAHVDHLTPRGKKK